MWLTFIDIASFSTLGGAKEPLPARRVLKSCTYWHDIRRYDKVEVLISPWKMNAKGCRAMSPTSGGCNQLDHNSAKLNDRRQLVRSVLVGLQVCVDLHPSLRWPAGPVTAVLTQGSLSKFVVP
ncbi:hypothetical protein PoMZ_07090 [Pyricularia oryzae]|uniref:Uncharacterized protein n=1 Tax=Pyricularia oryzae TaxID=318829 RepID=A0A4P7NE93_PYROR|nr:hypothetical protein PoMZ_07090 [Pyricularia oryzae]